MTDTASNDKYDFCPINQIEKCDRTIVQFKYLIGDALQHSMSTLFFFEWHIKLIEEEGKKNE